MPGVSSKQKFNTVQTGWLTIHNSTPTMSRLNEAERGPMLAAHLSHWTQADALAGGPVGLQIINPDGTAGTYTRADLTA